MTTMKILEGTTDAANQSYYAAEGLKALGYDARCAHYTSCEYFLEGDFEFGFDRAKRVRYPLYAMRMAAFAYRAAREYDVFHFHCGRSLLPKNLDLGMLDKKGKGYFFEYHGSEIRQGSHWRENPYSDRIPLYFENDAAVRRAEMQLAHARGAIVHDAEMGLYVPRVAPLYYVPLRIDADRFSPNFPDGDASRRPLVVHAPSSRSVKGSDVIESVLDELSASYDFDVRIIHDVPQVEAFEIYRQADIVIDQLYIGTYGVFALEAMALGKPVVTYLRPDLKEAFPKDLPIVSASEATLKEAWPLCWRTRPSSVGWGGWAGAMSSATTTIGRSRSFWPSSTRQGRALATRLPPSPKSLVNKLRFVVLISFFLVPGAVPGARKAFLFLVCSVLWAFGGAGIMNNRRAFSCSAFKRFLTGG